ncbi:uncharacterized protein HSISB1_1785 [Streptococcus sp. HSISB1]|nr:uncharacterized protein HSISB1_1785 [Streptococcus sp. HSISB1]
MIAISEIKKNAEGIAFNESLNIKETLMQRSSEVLDVKEVLVNGLVTYDDGLYLLNYRLDYTITLPSSRSMKPVDVHQIEDVTEVFVESADLHAKEDLVKENLALVLENDFIDLEESAVDNIILTIPMQVLSDEERQSEDMPSGQNWSVMTEDQYEALQNEKKKKTTHFQL